MKKQIFSIVLIVLALCQAVSAQVDIKVSVLPPYPSKVTDYTSRPQQVLIVLRSVTNLAQDIQLRGTITGDNGIVLRVDPHYKSPVPIHLNGGETRNLNASDISQLFDYNTLDFSGINKETVIRGNGLPEGNYQVCVQAYNYQTNQPISSGQPLGCSNSFPITSVEPPVILTPFDDQPVSALTTQNFVISWTTPAGAPPSTQYTVSMVEILDSRSPNDAVNSATSPLFFQQTVNAANLLLYGPAMPTLTPGRRYALLVAAKDPFNAVTFRNNGRSEVTSFIYGDTTGTGGGAGNGATTTNPPANTNMPSQTIKGRLTWYYRKSEETAPATATKFTPPGRYTGMSGMSDANMGIVNMTMKDPTFVAGVKQTLVVLSTGTIAGSANASGPSMKQLNSQKPTAPVVPSSTQQILQNKPYAISLVGTGLGAIMPSNDPAYFSTYGRESHPMAGTIIKLMATDATHPGASPQLAGTATTDDQGNFQLSFIPPAAFGSGKGFTYSLSVQDNYFSIPAMSFTIPGASGSGSAGGGGTAGAGGGSYDLGEIRALANTYRLTAFADDDTRAEVPLANISVYRRADFYASNPALKTEGNIDENNRPAETIDGLQYVKISSINDAYTGTRLFYSAGNGDEYKVRITAPNFSPNSTTLEATTVLTNPTAPQILQEIYQLSAAPTTFSGTVSQTTGGAIKQAIPGAVVTLYLTDSAYNAAKGIKKALYVGTIAGGADRTSYQPTSAGATQNNAPSPKNGQAMVQARSNGPATRSGATSGGGTTSGGSGSAGGNGGTSGNSQFAMKISPAGLMANIKLSINQGQMTATTDSSGAFTFSNVPTNPLAMHYIITVPGTTLDHWDTVTLVAKGASRHADYVFNFIAYAVTGRVVDENKKGIPNALLHWASGNSEIPVNADGYFSTTTKAGTDTLISKALGYQDQRTVVSINQPLLSKDPPVATAGSGGNSTVLKMVAFKTPAGLGNANKSGGGSGSGGGVGAGNGSNAGVSDARTASFVAEVQATDAYKQSVAQGTPMDPKSFGFTAKSSASWANSQLSPQDNPSGAVTVPDIVLKKEIGRMLVTVEDAGGLPLANATIQIDGTDSTELTGSDGKRYIQGPAGDLQLIIGGPKGSKYAPQEVALTVNEVDTAKKTIRLVAGIQVTGQVMAGGKAAVGATVAIEGLVYLNTKTDGSGNYTLIVSRDTSYTFKASETGYVSSPQTKTFGADGTLNFTLGTASFNISKILGFAVQIDNIADESGSSTRKKLTGSFISLPGNAVFSVRAGVSIPFTDAEVDIVNNTPVPVGGVVTTDATNLPLKAFNFLPVKLTNSSGGQLVVRQIGSATDAGQLEGIAAIDYASFMPAGITSYVDASLKEYVQTTASSSPQTMGVLTSSGALTATSLFIAGAGTQSFNLYGFNVTLDLANSSVKSDGLHLKGSVSLGSIPMMGNTTFQIQDLWVGANGYISGVKVNMDPAPSISIAGWGATLTGLSFNDNGFSISGNLKVQIPGSQASEIDFANLNISTDQLYGGSFTIPSAGIDVFGIVKFLGGPTPLSFGKLGSSNVYYIGGSGTVQFPSLFGNMSLQFFQIQTNGQFAATVQTNINENFFDVAQVAITDLSFHTNNGIGVDVQGNFLLSIPYVKATVGGVHFGTGGSVSVDQLGLSFSMVGVATVSANLSFVNQPDKKGFSGDGAITIAGLPGAKVSFSYYKVPNGVSVSAFFQANVIIPVAGIFSINNPGGGFSLNTGDGSWSVTITGDASITGLGTAVSVANISVTVTNGPVITGSANLQVFTLNLAKVSMVVDVPKTLLSISFNAGIDIIPKVITAQGAGTFVLSGAKGDTYFMIAANYHSTLFGIFDENANIAAGWGLNINNHPEYNQFTSFIPPPSDGILRGVYLNLNSNISFYASGSIYIAQGTIYYKNYASVIISMGIGTTDYDLSIGAGWGCGGSLSVPELGNIASLDIGSAASIFMHYSSGCFSVGGKLAAWLSASIGNCDNDCFIGLCMHDLGPLHGVVPEGGKICAYPSLDVGYDCNTGFHLAVDL